MDTGESDEVEVLAAPQTGGSGTGPSRHEEAVTTTSPGAPAVGWETNSLGNQSSVQNPTSNNVQQQDQISPPKPRPCSEDEVIVVDEEKKANEEDDDGDQTNDFPPSRPSISKEAESEMDKETQSEESLSGENAELQRVWDEWFKLLVEYKKQYGHAGPAQDSVFRDNKLGEWAENQRKMMNEYKYKREEIAPDVVKIAQMRIARLDSVGFSWGGRSREQPKENAQTINKSTNNQRERHVSSRSRRPHVIFAEKLEAIRSAVESRPNASPFLKPVNQRLIPRYSEMIGKPMDLSSIRKKINGNEYPTASAFLEDFALIKSNAIKSSNINGQSNQIAQEAIAIYDYVKNQIQAIRSELSSLEAAMETDYAVAGRKKSLRSNNKATSPQQVWDNMLNLLVEYKLQQGHPNPPFGTIYKGEELGKWCASQRFMMKQKVTGKENPSFASITDSRIQRLNEVGGFEWNVGPNQQSNKNGEPTANEPSRQNNLTTTQPRQRAIAPTNQAVQTDTQAATEISQRSNQAANQPSQPDRGDEAWEDWFSLLVSYTLEKGHCSPPFNAIFRGKQLGNWVAAQRLMMIEKKTGKESQSFASTADYRIKSLNGIDFVWDPSGKGDVETDKVDKSKSSRSSKGDRGKSGGGRKAEKSTTSGGGTMISGERAETLNPSRMVVVEISDLWPYSFDATLTPPPRGKPPPGKIWSASKGTWLALSNSARETSTPPSGSPNATRGTPAQQSLPNVPRETSATESTKRPPPAVQNGEIDQDAEKKRAMRDIVLGIPSQKNKRARLGRETTRPDIGANGVGSVSADRAESPTRSQRNRRGYLSPDAKWSADKQMWVDDNDKGVNNPADQNRKWDPICQMWVENQPMHKPGVAGAGKSLWSDAQGDEQWDHKTDNVLGIVNETLDL